MSNVTSLAGVRHKETIGVLRHLLERAERGEIGGVFFAVRDREAGADLTGRTGFYRENPRMLGMVLAPVCVELCLMRDQVEAKGASQG